MMYRKSVVAAVAALSLGFGTMCTATFAQDAANPTGKQIPDKNPSDADLQQKEAMQEKMKQDLTSNFNDADFVTVASLANQAEIDAAKAALAKTTNDDVKNFAQHMIDDHTAAGAELKALADGKGWQVSDRSDIKHMLALKEMNKMNGPDFDKAYSSQQVADHQDAVALFKLAADKASDADLKAFASKEVPTFETHLKMAQDLENKVSSVTLAK